MYLPTLHVHPVRGVNRECSIQEKKENEEEYLPSTGSTLYGRAVQHSRFRGLEGPAPLVGNNLPCEWRDCDCVRRETHPHW